MPATATWPDDIHRALAAADARQIAYVPDAGHARLIRLCQADPGMTAVALTSEEEGIALLAGAWLGGQRGALLMQSSGIGNCINMLSLARTCRMPLVMLVTMRGEAGETNPWQLPMGAMAAEVLGLAGVEARRADAADAVGPAVAAAARAAFEGSGGRAAVLIGQALIGIKNFDGDEQ